MQQNYYLVISQMDNIQYCTEKLSVGWPATGGSKADAIIQLQSMQ